jgi:hypothetical protein
MATKTKKTKPVVSAATLVLVENLSKKAAQIEEISRLALQVQQIEVAHIFFENINKLSK